MTPHTNAPGSAPTAPSTPGPPDRSQPLEPAPAATPGQRMGLAVLSLFFLVFLVNIMGALARDFGPVGASIGLAAACLVVLGVNIPFNLDLLRRHR